MTVTIQDIAAKVHLSVATVSQTLSNHPKAQKFHPDTRRRIEEAARELNYRPSFAGKALRSGKTLTLALMVGGIKSPYFAELADTALHQATQLGYHLLVSVTEWDAAREDACLRQLMQGRVDGVLLHACSLQAGSALHRHVIEMRFPVVVFDDIGLPDIRLACTDFRPGMKQALAALAERGHRQVLFVGDDGPCKSKETAFIQACQDLKLTPAVRHCTFDVESALEAGEIMARERHRAVIVYSDYAALGVMKGLRKAGRRVPADVDVIGIDGTQWATLCEPSLASIVANSHDMVARGLDLLLAQIENRDAPVEHLTVPSYFRSGDSISPSKPS